MPVTLHGSAAMVCGFGRIGKLLAARLAAIGARVLVAARKVEDFAWIEAYGYTPIHINKIVEHIGECNVIFNTVPALILGRHEFARIDNSPDNFTKTIIIDLASKPGGVDFDEAKSLGIEVIWALSLPGKYAPATSGRIVRDSIINIMRERGVFSI